MVAIEFTRRRGARAFVALSIHFPLSISLRFADTIRYSGDSLFEPDFLLRMRLAENSIDHRCHTEFVHVHIILRFLHKSVRQEEQRLTVSV